MSSMPQFFVSTSDVNADIITISDKQNYRHIVKVLRAKLGETLLLVDENQTQYKVVIQSIDLDSITTKVVDVLKSNHSLRLNLFLAQAVLKNDAQSMVVQKSTELGVKGIIPLITDNCVVKASVVDTKIDKWQRVANEAVKQCERTDFPKVDSRKTLKDVLDNSDFSIKIACVERSQDKTMKDVLRGIKVNECDKILIIIGPEGGFSASELAFLNNRVDVYKVSLGNLILRAETAVITSISNVIYELE